MKTIVINGRETSCLALGSSYFGGEQSEGLAFDLMDAFVSVGGSYIDTAHVYGDFKPGSVGKSEAVIGHWLESRHNRDRIFLSTKGAHPPIEDMCRGRLSRADIRSDISESLDALRTDHVDIYWLHRDDVSRPVGDILETLEGLLQDKLTGMVGVSNWTTKRIREANEYAQKHGLTGIQANQPRFSLAKQLLVEDPTLVEMDSEMYKMHVETNMLCTPFSSQAKGFFSKLNTLGEDGLSDKARRRFLYPINLETYKRVKNVQAETGLTVGEIAVAYLTSQPFPIVPLCGASRVEQALELGKAGDATLTPEQRDYLFKY